MIEYKFFNSTEQDKRRYNASDFTDYFAKSFKSGVYLNSLIPNISGNDMNVTINAGSGLIKGYMITLTEKEILTAEQSHAVLDRIDRVILKLNLEARKIELLVKKGVENENPVAPNLTENEISLCQFRIRATKNIINSSDFIDERMKTGFINDNRENELYNMTVKQFDENNNPTEIEYRTLNNLLFKKTLLTDKNNLSQYETLYEQNFLEDGTKIGLTRKYKIKYNNNGSIISRECEVF